MIAQSLAGRLLCACNLAYGASRPAYIAGTGFTTLQPFYSPDKTNAAIVGTNQDGVVVAFRGTINPIDESTPVELRLHDWLDDFRENLVTHNGPGKVHAGFLAAVNSLWTDVSAEIERQLAKIPEGSPVYFAGHSKAGGMAPIAAARWAMADDSMPVTTTFAAPKCGDSDFAKAFVWPCARYEFKNDVVPFLPPGKSLHDIISLVAPPFARVLPDRDYKHVGKLIYRGFDDYEQKPDSQWDEDLLNEGRILALWGNVNLGTFIRDHHISVGSGYWDWICPELSEQQKSA